ncbi:uncharacterized protein LOC143197516 [Rhynchophorus ferrugineus]|uniref:Uncharacterized protein n=1 Tax=Rhynchophorus ferrugineus TaxID=354439 RepID=A0A834HXY5_RHYFE|nr:hypothetical protein GWI33_016829 [Rhynchophorus ferrugineus]
MEFCDVTPQNVHTLTAQQIDHIIKPLFMPDEWEYMSPFDRQRYRFFFVLYVSTEDRERYALPEYLRIKRTQFMTHLNQPPVLRIVQSPTDLLVERHIQFIPTPPLTYVEVQTEVDVDSNVTWGYSGLDEAHIFPEPNNNDNLDNA